MIALNKLIKQGKAPTKKSEKWRYSDLSLLEIPKSHSKASVNDFDIKLDKDRYYYITFIDGEFSKKNSFLPESGIKISSLNQEQILDLEVFEYKHQVIQNLGNSKDVTLINISKSTDKPVKLVRILSSSASFSSIYLRLEKNSNCTLYEEIYTSCSKPQYLNSFLKIVLDDDSSLKHFLNKSLQGMVKALYTTEISCQTRASYSNYSVNSCYKSYRFEAEAQLDGEAAKANFYGVCIAKSNQIFDCVINVKHNASKTSSIQHYNQVLGGNSNGSFYSNVFIPEKLSELEAHQLNKNVLLDDKSKAFSRPTLDINSEDVICSHGSTTGSIDLEMLQYLSARGISKTKAKDLIVIGLLKSVFSICDLSEEEQSNLNSQIQNSI